MWKTILVPHDFSAGSGRAAALARDLARVHGARLVFLHVAELPPLLGPGASIVPDEGGAPISVADYAVQSAGDRLAELVTEYGQGGVEASFEAVIGSPATEITAVAERLGVDVIVIGTHGRSGLAKVVRHSKVPVVSVRIED
jgi:universal stress protein A